jgi:hypothetical protein
MSPDNSAEVTLREITEETLGTILQLEVAEVSSQTLRSAPTPNY